MDACIKGQFAKRLIGLLKENGFLSTRAPEGVSVKQLVATIGCTRAMARRYVNGTAIPDHSTLIVIARWLRVKPGWLLFGDEPVPEHITPDTEKVIMISKDVTLRRSWIT